jgi:hypothetical protein
MRSERRREFERQYKKNYRKSLREKVFNILGHKCSKCGFSDIRALQIDHKNGGGKKDRQLLNNLAIYRKVIKNSMDYQILCANCNWIKREESNEVLKYRESKIIFNKKPRVKVQQIKNGKVIATYKSLVEAYRRTGIPFTTISAVVRGLPHRKTAGGFNWKAVETNNDEDYSFLTKPQPKEVIDYPLTLKL